MVTPDGRELHLLAKWDVSVRGTVEDDSVPEAMPSIHEIAAFITKHLPRDLSWKDWVVVEVSDSLSAARVVIAPLPETDPE